MQSTVGLAVQEPDLQGAEVDRPVSVVLGQRSHRFPAQRITQIDQPSIPNPPFPTLRSKEVSFPLWHLWMNLMCSVSGLAFCQGTTFLLIVILLVLQESVTYVPGLSVTSLPGLYHWPRSG